MNIRLRRCRFSTLRVSPYFKMFFLFCYYARRGKELWVETVAGQLKAPRSLGLCLARPCTRRRGQYPVSPPLQRRLLCQDTLYASKTGHRGSWVLLRVLSLFIECLLLIQASHSAGPSGYGSSLFPNLTGQGEPRSRLVWFNTGQPAKLKFQRNKAQFFSVSVFHAIFWSLSQAVNRRLHKEGKVLRNAEGGFLSGYHLCGTSSARPLGPALHLWDSEITVHVDVSVIVSPRPVGALPGQRPQLSYSLFWFPASRCSRNTCWVDEWIGN